MQGQKFEYLLNTGNLISRSGLDLSQATGFTVVAEKLNYHRYVDNPTLVLGRNVQCMEAVKIGARSTFVDVTASRWE